MPNEATMPPTNQSVTYLFKMLCNQALALIASALLGSHCELVLLDYLISIYVLWCCDLDKYGFLNLFMTDLIKGTPTVKMKF